MRQATACTSVALNCSLNFNEKSNLTMRLEAQMVLRIIVCVIAVVAMTATLSTGAISSETPSAASQSDSNAQAQSYQGVVTDTHCYAKHSASLAANAGDCTIRCVRAGEQFALVDGESTYLLEGDPVILKQSAGRRVKVVGTLNERRISVTSIVAP